MGERMHQCFWPGCQLLVPMNMFGCYPHWRRLPKPMRDEIWDAYRDSDRSRQLASHQQAIEWAKAKDNPGVSDSVKGAEN